MTRDPVVAKTQATALDCHEARQWLRTLLSGSTGLTERALVEAHLMRCASCRLEEARLRRVVTARGLTPLLRPALRLTSSAIASVNQASRLGISDSADLITRLHTTLCVGRAHLAHAGVRVMRAIILGSGQSFRPIAHLGSRVAAALALSAHVVTTDVRLGMARVARRVVRLRPRLAISLRGCLRVVGVVVMLTLTSYTWHWVLRPQQPARAAAPSFARVERTPVESPLPPSPVTLSAEPTLSAPAAWRPARPPRSGPAPAAPSPPRASAGNALAVPVPVPEHDGAISTVIGRLSARTRTAAESDLAALLTGVGGTEIGRQRHTAFVAVRVVVPHSGYDEFTRGLARIGAWQLEAARSPLPEAVHMTIRVTD